MKPKPILKNSCLQSGARPLVSRNPIPLHRQKAFGTPRGVDRGLGFGDRGLGFWPWPRRV